MKTKWAGHPARSYDIIDSTNLCANREAENGASEGTLITAEMQTDGRGRRGRSWESPPGVNLYYSLILRPQYAPDKASMVTLVMALAVAEGIRETCGVRPDIKWPNDIVINGKKVCGILTEMRPEKQKIHHVVIGVGINVLKQDFSPEISNTAASLQEACGVRAEKAVLLENILTAFEGYYERFCMTENLSGLREMYNSMLAGKDREVRVLDPQGEYCGVSRGIDETGQLLVEAADGSVEKVYAGEVSVRGIYGYV